METAVLQKRVKIVAISLLMSKAVAAACAFRTKRLPFHMRDDIIQVLQEP